MQGGVIESKQSIKQADLIKSELMTVPVHIGEFVLSRFLLDLHQLKEALKQADKISSSILLAKTNNDGKEMLKTADKLATIKTESLKLMGSYYWVIAKQRKAIHLWRKAIQEGQRLNDRLGLSRTYFDVGKSLLEPTTKYKELNGITAEAYLEKSKTIFEEMDLQWDLDELDKVMAKI